MNRIVLSLTVGLCAAALLSGCARKSTEPAPQPAKSSHAGSTAATFGEPLKLTDADAVPVAKVLADPAAYNGRFIRVTGNVAEVCKPKGCWMRMAETSGGEALFVKFTCPIEGRLIPLEAVGHKAIAEGTLEVTEISEAQARHLAEDAGKSPDQIAKIVGPQKQIRFKSPAAMVLGIAPGT